MAKGVLPREWDGFNLNRFHCTADTVAPEWKSSPPSLSLAIYQKKSSWVSSCDVLLPLNVPEPSNVDILPEFLVQRQRPFGSCTCFYSESWAPAAWEPLFVNVESFCNEVLESTAAVDLEILVEHSEAISAQSPQWLTGRLGCLLLFYVPVPAWSRPDVLV